MSVEEIDQDSGGLSTCHQTCIIKNVNKEEEKNI